jgi:mannose-6-phosphate isomerase-like protein (cupin superfamily)
MSVLEPVVKPLTSLPVVEAADHPLRMRIARTVTRAADGSEVMAGIGWLAPGEASTVWSTEADPPTDDTNVFHVGAVHEFFFLIQGALRLEYAGGALDVAPNDTLYLPPGHRFRFTNTSSEEAFMVFGMAPPLA